MKFQALHVNPGEKLKKKDVNNDLSNFMSVFPSLGYLSIRVPLLGIFSFHRHQNHKHTRPTLQPPKLAGLSITNFSWPITSFLTILVMM